MTAHSAVAGVEINAKSSGRQDEVLSGEALAFIARLHRRFNRRRLELLVRRMERQEDFDAGKLPDFLPDTKSIREGDWTVVDDAQLSRGDCRLESENSRLDARLRTRLDSVIGAALGDDVPGEDIVEDEMPA